MHLRVVHVALRARHPHVAHRSGGHTSRRAHSKACTSRQGADVKSDEIITVIGAGRVGSALASIATDAGLPVRVVRRDDTDSGFCENTRGPIFVATHASDLDAVVQRVRDEAPSRLSDLIFLQGGLLRDEWLTKRGLENTTQAALYLSASGSRLTDGGGATMAFGPRANDVVDLLRLGNVAAKSVNRELYKHATLEKVIWTSAFWLLCDVGGREREEQIDVDRDEEHKGSISDDGVSTGSSNRESNKVTIGTLSDPGNEKSFARTNTLLRELWHVAVSSGEFKFLVNDCSDDTDQETARTETIAGVLSYSQSIPTAVPNREMALKEIRFRNAWFLGKKKTKLHCELLEKAGVDSEAIELEARDGSLD